MRAPGMCLHNPIRITAGPRTGPVPGEGSRWPGLCLSKTCAFALPGGAGPRAERQTAIGKVPAAGKRFHPGEQSPAASSVRLCLRPPSPPKPFYCGDPFAAGLCRPPLCSCLGQVRGH